MNNPSIDKNEPKLQLPFESVGRLIKNQREGLCISRVELCALIPCSTPCLKSWETGRILPNNKNLFLLAALFDMTPENILMGMSCIESVETETPEQVELTNDVLELLPEGLDENPVATVAAFERPEFNLIFRGDELVTIRVVQFCNTIDLSIRDFPNLVIDALSESVRSK